MSDPAAPKPSTGDTPQTPATVAAPPAAAPKSAGAPPGAAKAGVTGAQPAAATPPPKPAGPAPRAPADPPPSRGAGAVLTALAVALLAGGLGWVWQQQQQLAEQAVKPADAAALREQVRVLQQRIGQLEQRPAPAPADLRPLEQRLSALEQRPAPSAAPAAGPDPGLADRLAALDKRLGEAEQATTQARQAAMARLARIGRLQVAAVALEAGRPLGEIAGAPPALGRFATAPPPTEASLRLSFPTAAERARAASRAAGDEAGIGDRVWQRVRTLVTVKEGDTVLLGSPAAIVLGQAAERLNAGDLAGSVKALDGLDPGAAAAMAEWRGQASALLAARAALAAMTAE